MPVHLVTSASPPPGGPAPGTNLRSALIGGDGQNFVLLFQRYALHDQLLIESTDTFLVLNDDAMRLADSINRVHTAVRDAGTDMVTLSDLIEKGYGKELTDDGFLSDLEITSGEWARVLNDLEPLADAINAARTFLYVLADMLGITDADGVRAYFINELTRQIQDNLGLSDEVARRLVHIFGRIISETSMWNTGGPSPKSW